MLPVSVIIPTYNRTSLLRKAVLSVLGQDLSQVEVVVCDDGSNDDMQSIRELFQGNGATLVWSRTEERQGAQVARNRGLHVSSGEAILFMDSDDVLTGTGLVQLVRALDDDATLDYVFGKVEKTDEQLRPLTGCLPIGSAFGDEPVDIAGYHWHTMGALYRKSYLKDVGEWNESLTGSQDWEYQARVKIAGGRRMHVDALVGYWRQHDGSRVGTKAFRLDYVQSVVRACESILSAAKQAGCCSKALERRIAKRILIHALELGSNGYASERRDCIRRAAVCLSNDGLLRLLMKCGTFTPSVFDRILWRRHAMANA